MIWELLVGISFGLLLAPTCVSRFHNMNMIKEIVANRSEQLKADILRQLRAEQEAEKMRQFEAELLKQLEGKI